MQCIDTRVRKHVKHHLQWNRPALCSRTKRRQYLEWLEVNEMKSQPTSFRLFEDAVASKVILVTAKFVSRGRQREREVGATSGFDRRRLLPANLERTVNRLAALRRRGNVA
jgi:hypothetical protein